LLEGHRTGISTEQLSSAFSQADTRASAVFADWMWSPHWIERLRAGESPVNLIQSYVRPRGG
jgi:hypothetical protein